MYSSYVLRINIKKNDKHLKKKIMYLTFLYVMKYVY